MVERGGVHGVPLVEQHLEDPAVGVEGAAEEHGNLSAAKLSEPLLEIAVDRLRPAGEAHRGHAVTPLAQRFLGGRDHPGVVGQAEAVVGAQVEHVATGRVELVGAVRRGHESLGLVGARLVHGTGLVARERRGS